MVVLVTGLVVSVDSTDSRAVSAGISATGLVSVGPARLLDSRVGEATVDGLFAGVGMDCRNDSGQCGYAASGVWNDSNTSSGVRYPSA